MTDKRQTETEVLLRAGSAYMAWRKAAIESKRALDAWLDCTPRDEKLLYVTYRAALDREEAAAAALESWEQAGEHRAMAARRAMAAVNPGRGHRYAMPIVHELPRRRTQAE